MLEIIKLKKYFGGVKAVNGCSFNVKEKVIVALIGPNGAGKSTIFNLISGILRADSGKIIFNHHNITNQFPDAISNRGISRLFQDVRLFENLTVLDNLILAIDNNDTKFWNIFFDFNHQGEEKKQKVRSLLKLVSLDGLENKLARDLSFGQKKLLGLARAILNPHQLLILDEPVAGINPKLKKQIADILLRLKRGGESILLIEHDMYFTYMVADYIIVMDAGKVIAEGRPEQIKNNPIVLEAYLGN